MFVDPDTQKQTFVYFKVLKMDDFGQFTLGMMAAIKHSFKENKLTELRDEPIYLSAGGVSSSSGKDSGLIAQFQEVSEWVLLVCCFSHWFDLPLKDSLQDIIKPVDELLMTLCYLYHKLSKKLRELKSLLKDIKEDFEMWVKSTATHWIDHRIQAMGHVINNFGQYARHLKDFIARKKPVNSKQLFKVR